MQCTRGAVGDALAAESAVVGSHGVHMRAASGVHEVPNAERLHLLACGYAAQAVHAFLGLAYEREPRVDGLGLEERGIGHLVDAHAVGKRLQLAGSVAEARGAASIVPRKDELQVCHAGAPHARRVGVDHHAIRDFVVACGHEVVDALDLHEAYAARADLVDLAQVAQVGMSTRCSRATSRIVAPSSAS